MPGNHGIDPYKQPRLHLLPLLFNNQPHLKDTVVAMATADHMTTLVPNEHTVGRTDSVTGTETCVDGLTQDLMDYANAFDIDFENRSEMQLIRVTSEDLEHGDDVDNNIKEDEVEMLITNAMEIENEHEDELGIDGEYGASVHHTEETDKRPDDELQAGSIADQSEESETDPHGVPADLGHMLTTAEHEKILDQLTGPHRVQYERIMKSKPEKDYFQITHGEGRSFTNDELARLDYLRTTVPVHQFRAYSLGGSNRSAGFSSPVLFLPNSYRHHLPVYRSLKNMKVNDAAVGVSAHSCWIGRREDELLSWTSSMFLVLTHAILRYEKGQHDVIVAGGNITKLQTEDGQAAEFYPVVPLKQLLPYVKISGLGKKTLVKLKPRHFTQEAVSAGELWDPKRAVAHVPLETLVRKGLFELMPELLILHPFLERTGLYAHVLWMKNRLFRCRRAKSITTAELRICDGLASCYMMKHATKAPFWCFIKFLSVRLRPERNPAFRKWVRKHYEKSDIIECVYKDMEKLADNLPDVKQCLNLAREAAEALQLEPNPIPIVAKGGGMHSYATEESRLWPDQVYDLSTIEEHLIKKAIYGSDEVFLVARRELAKCNNEEMAILLKLVRLAIKSDDPAGFDSGKEIEDEQLKIELELRGIMGPKQQTKSKSMSLFDEVAEVKPAEEKKREERAERKEKAEKKKNNALEKTASNRQDRTELNKKLGLPSPKEMREQKAKERAERAKQAAEEAKSGKTEYRLFSDRSGKRKVLEMTDPEFAEEKRSRPEKTIEELRADFLAELELLSGRLRHREIARDKLAKCHQHWVTKERLRVIYGIVHEARSIGLDRIGVDGVEFENKTACKAGVGPGAIVM